MPEQFENAEATKVDNEIASNASTKKKLELVADKAAVKSTKTVQSFDKDNSNLFSK
jgi:hypothetical protein